VIGSSISVRRIRGSLLLVVLTAAGLFSAPSVASGANSLSSVLLSHTLPGFIVSPPGARNGPINQSNLSLVTGGTSSPADTQFAQLLASGNVSGYIRSWVHLPVNGDAIVVEAFQFQDQSQAASFVNGENGSLPQQPGVSPWAVPSVPGAAGYLVHTSAAGTPISEYVVVFGKGNTDVQVILVTQSGDLTAADATALASQQWASVPTPTNWTPIIALLSFIGVVVLSLLIILVARTRRYPDAFTVQPMARDVGPWGPPMTLQGQQS